MWQLVRDALWPEGETGWVPLAVACYACEMTMWATSENALCKDEGAIYCRGCAAGHLEPGETLPEGSPTPTGGAS